MVSDSYRLGRGPGGVLITHGRCVAGTGVVGLGRPKEEQAGGAGEAAGVAAQLGAVI